MMAFAESGVRVCRLLTLATSSNWPALSAVNVKRYGEGCSLARNVRIAASLKLRPSGAKVSSERGRVKSLKLMPSGMVTSRTTSSSAVLRPLVISRKKVDCCPTRMAPVLERNESESLPLVFLLAVAPGAGEGNSGPVAGVGAVRRGLRDSSRFGAWTFSRTWRRVNSCAACVTIVSTCSEPLCNAVNTT